MDCVFDFYQKEIIYRNWLISTDGKYRWTYISLKENAVLYLVHMI